MGSASSHPPQPPLIALNGGSFGKHNTILVPAEAFTGKWAPKWKGKGRPNYRPTYPDPFAYLPPLPRVGRRRGRRAVRFEEPLSEGDMRLRRKGVGRRRPGGGMPMAYFPGVQGAAPQMMYDARGARAMSTPNFQTGFMPMPMPMPVRGGRAKNMGLRGGNAPMMVPGYAPPSGMPGPAYAPPPVASPFPAQAQPRMPPRAPPQQKMRHPPGVEAVAGGHFAQHPSQPPRRNSEPPVSAMLNRSQPTNRRAGPSGHEWLPSDNAFLDACTCTTNCNCRKGARVLYRHQGQGQGQGDGEHNTWGEIRYLLKDDLGRDCGDHSRCKIEESESGEKKRRKDKGNKGIGESADVERMREEMRGLREDIQNMRIGGGRMGTSGVGGLGTMAPQGGWEGVMGGEMDPRMVQRMGMNEAYGMDFLPRMQQQMMGGRPGRRMAAMGPGDDASFRHAEDMMDPMMAPGMLNLPPHLRNAGMRRPKQRRGPPRRAPDFDPHLEYAPRPRPRRNMPMPMPRQRGGGGPAPPPADYNLEDESMGSGLDGRGHFGPMNDDDDDAGNWPPPGGSRPGA